MNPMCAKGDIGSLLFFEEQDELGVNYMIAIVDGEKIKPDVLYTVKDGAFVEATDV